MAIHLLRTGAAPGAIPRDVVSSRSILVRWEWALRVRRFGLDPKGLEERHGELLQGIFLTAAHDTPDFEGFRHMVADSLNQLDRPITSAVLAEKFAEHNIKLRVEDVFTVLCTVGEQGADVAQYCLLKACAEVTNPREICSAIRGGLED